MGSLSALAMDCSDKGRQAAHGTLGFRILVSKNDLHRAGCVKHLFRPNLLGAMGSLPALVVCRLGKGGQAAHGTRR